MTSFNKPTSKKLTLPTLRRIIHYMLTTEVIRYGDLNCSTFFPRLLYKTIIVSHNSASIIQHQPVLARFRLTSSPEKYYSGISTLRSERERTGDYTFSRQDKQVSSWLLLKHLLCNTFPLKSTKEKNTLTM